MFVSALASRPYVPPTCGITLHLGRQRQRRTNVQQQADVPASLLEFLESQALKTISLDFKPHVHCEHDPSKMVARLRKVFSEEKEMQSLLAYAPKVLDGRSVRMVYDIDQEIVYIGKGTFGYVLLAQMVNSGQLVALKLFKKNSKCTVYFMVCVSFRA